jgi:carbamoyl-phosphate synthase small subunit
MSQDNNTSNQVATTRGATKKKRLYSEASGEVGYMALADGTIFAGKCFGALRKMDDPVMGEAVFNTSMYGYQEILTDPSYAGQVMCFTYPHIGNVGCNEEDVESSKVYTEGLIVRAAHKIPSNFRATTSLPSYLHKNGIMGIEGIDTRQLVAHLRDKGAQMCAIAGGDSVDPKALVEVARAQGSMEGKDYVKAVSCKDVYGWDFLSWSLKDGNDKRLSQEQLVSRPHVVAIDCGIKHNILRLLVDVGFRLTVVPAGYTSEQIMSLRPDGLFLSNGPGDPATLSYVVNPVRELLGKVPMFGICLGHQILGQALGGSTYKLKFGHRGGNHPVRDETTGKVEITVQNHGFAVVKDSLSKEVSITHINLNDQTVEGLASRKARAFSVQYHPESSPGPHDARYLFKRFYDLVMGGELQG